MFLDPIRKKLSVAMSWAPPKTLQRISAFFAPARMRAVSNLGIPVSKNMASRIFSPWVIFEVGSMAWSIPPIRLLASWKVIPKHEPKAWVAM